MKHFYSSILLVFCLLSISSALNAQCPPDFHFESQAEVDAFIIDYPNCTNIDGNLVMYDVFDITNVDGFANVTSITGNLYLERLIYLTNLDGFSNLESIGGYLYLWQLWELTGLQGLSSLNSVTEYVTITDLRLITNLQGLENLEYVGVSLGVTDCDDLTSLEGLENLKTVGGLGFSDNSSFGDMTAVDNVIEYGQDFLGLSYNYGMGGCTTDLVCEFLAPSAVYIDNAPPCTDFTNVIELCSFATIAPGTLDECQTIDPVEISDAQGNTYKANFLDNDGNIVCTIEADGNELGLTEVELYTSSTTRFYNGTAYINRDISITPEFQPTSDVCIMFYFTAEDFADLQAADPSITSIEDLNFSKTDVGCTGAFSGVGSEITQISSNEHGLDGDWWVRIVVSSFSTFFASGTTFTLPVDLLKFEGQRKDENNVLSWATAAEINNDYFAIMHSTDGKKFKEIAKVTGAGNSTQELDYTYTHKAVSAAHSYYKLKQVDYNGDYKYSDIIQISNTNSKLRIAPNPADGFITVYSNAIHEDMTIEIFDLLGKRELKSQVNAGQSIDISNLPVGMYNMIIRSGQESTIESFIKR